jgi:hypothetical protein
MTRAEAQRSQAAYDADQARQEAERRANQAEAATILAESRAEKAEERAREAEKTDSWNRPSQPPVYWGGWGYSVTGWPSTANVQWKAGYQPARSQPVTLKPPK